MSVFFSQASDVLPLEAGLHMRQPGSLDGGGTAGHHTQQPAITVVTPFYNRRDWLAPYLHMLEAQTLRDFEAVIVDDGSTDGLVDAVASARTSFPIRCVRLAVNRGAGAARNVGIDAARGRYVALLDSDDAWRPEKLEHDVARFAAAQDRDRLVGLSRHVVIGRQRFVRPDRLITRSERVGHYLFQLGGVIHNSTMFLTTDLARSARFAEGEPGHDDWTFALRLEAIGARFEMTPAALTYYRDDDRPDRRSPRQAQVSLQWLERYRHLLGEGPYLAARAVFASHMPRDAWLTSPPMIMAACLRGAVPLARCVYYLGAWACPATRKLGIYTKQRWARAPEPAFWHGEPLGPGEDPARSAGRSRGSRL